MKIKDDRTEEFKKSNHVIIAATDSFMSGWGETRGGTSYCGWACRPEQAAGVWRWVKSRREMKRVREVLPTWRPKGGDKDHCHIYVVDDGHPALR